MSTAEMDATPGGSAAVQQVADVEGDGGSAPAPAPCADPAQLATAAPAEDCTTPPAAGDCTSSASAGDCTSPPAVGDCTSPAPAGDCTTPASAGDCTSPAPAEDCTTPPTAGDCTTPASAGDGAHLTAAPSDGVSAPAVVSKPGGFELWRGRLRSARMVVAPMVDQSEPAWRMLSRKYGAELCYTPMYHASMFMKDVKYRRDCLTTYPEDRPLIIQFCANNPATLLAAARCCQGGKFDALDINLGCPQAIARRGHYGAFLQDEWELISQLVKVVHEQTDLPVTCKIRVFDDLDKTIRYARMLESAGCQLLSVHGRTRDMKGPLTALADWDAIKAVREAVSIPVFANGNIQYLADVHRCLEQTGVQGVMSAEGNLHNPALFTGRHPPVWQMAEEYLQLSRRYPCPLSYARGHVFKILHYCLLMPANHDVRQLLARATRFDQLEEAVSMLKERYSRYSEPGGPVWEPGPDEVTPRRLPLSPLLCQPHEREPIEDHLKKMQANTDKQRQERRQLQQVTAGSAPPPADADAAAESQPPARAQDLATLSKRKLKKLSRGVKLGVNRTVMEKCSLCCNMRGLRCEFVLCRVHCRTHCYERNLDCLGHGILVKSNRQNARRWHDKRRAMGEAENGSDGEQTDQQRQHGDAGEMDPSSAGEVQNGEKNGDAGEMDPSSGGEVQNGEKNGDAGEMDYTAMSDTQDDSLAMDSSAAAVS